MESYLLDFKAEKYGTIIDEEIKIKYFPKPS